jgi:hypothetical protein
MSVFTFYIFDRAGACLYYHEWRRPRPAAAGAGSMPEDFKLVFGLVWSLRSFAAALDPRAAAPAPMGTPARIGDGAGFQSFRTEAYKLHFLEVPSGLKFVLTTAPHVGPLLEQMRHVYRALFVEHVAKNPLYAPGDAFLFEPFTVALNKYVHELGLLP